MWTWTLLVKQQQQTRQNNKVNVENHFLDYNSGAKTKVFFLQKGTKGTFLLRASNIHHIHTLTNSYWDSKGVKQVLCGQPIQKYDGMTNGYFWVQPTNMFANPVSFYALFD